LSWLYDDVITKCENLKKIEKIIIWTFEEIFRLNEKKVSNEINSGFYVKMNFGGVMTRALTK